MEWENASIVVPQVTVLVVRIVRTNIMNMTKMKKSVSFVVLPAMGADVQIAHLNIISTEAVVISADGVGHQVLGADVRTIPTKFTKNRGCIFLTTDSD